MPKPHSILLSAGAGLLRYSDRSARETVLDFERRRHLVIDRSRGAFTDDSLFATVGGRSVELRNRAHIHRVLQAGGADASGFGPLVVEHQLSLLGTKSTTTIGVAGIDRSEEAPRGLRRFFRKSPPPPPGDIVGHIAGDNVVYQAGAQCLFTHARDGFDAKPDGFIQFLRYRYGGHPRILAEVAKLKFLPRAISLHALQPAQFDAGPVTLRPCAPRRIADEKPRTTGLEEVADLDTEDAIDSALTASRATSRNHPALSTDERLAQALSLIRSGDALEGALRFFELTLEAAVALSPEIATALSGRSDPRVMALMASLQLKDKDSARQAVAIQAGVRETMTSGNAALDAFEAEARLAMGEPQKAKDLLARAVTTNPRLVGAYTTLGDIYLAGFDARRAWRCWDLARTIFPSHPILKGPAAFEAMLSGQHPEYLASPHEL